MDKAKMGSFTIVAAIIGMMIAIQFQTVKKPVERDTRDIWQLQEDLLKEKELESSLLKEIRSNEEKLSVYHSNKQYGKEAMLKETLAELKMEAGLTEVKGPGVILKIEPVMEAIKPGDVVSTVIAPELLQRLLNELNMYEAKYVSIDGQRIINTTVIRDINKETKIDGHVIRTLPVEVKVVADTMDTARKLYNQMQVSKSVEEFFIDNLRLTVSQPKEGITIPPYENPIHIRGMVSVEGEKGGNS